MPRENRGAVAYQLFQWLWVGADLLFPPNCASCGVLGTQWCCYCHSEISGISSSVCQICGVPRASEGVCAQCLQNPPIFTFVRSFAIYQDLLKKSVVQLKYHGNGGLGEVLSWSLINLLQNLSWDFDMIIPVPQAQNRRKERGYNQASFLSWPIAL